MIQLYDGGVYLVDGETILADTADACQALRAAGKETTKEHARQGTIADSILCAHNLGSKDDVELAIKFDALASHDITYVGIVQTARASGLEKFPIPYVLTNCHNSLCAVGGTINEDDHLFGLSAAQKYGGVYVPAHLAVIHQYMREKMAGCGKMILGSDSHTRYGALGTMAVGEGGPELVKQLLGRTYQVARPDVVGVYLTGAPLPGVGPQDVALAIIGAVFENGFVKNKVMEFIGDGIGGLNMEYRNGIDVMTTETTCLTSIWKTDEKTREYLRVHGREEDYRPLAPADVAYYDGFIKVDLSRIRPMIAMPFHPSNTYTIEEVNANLADILHEVEKKGAEQMDCPGVSFNLRDKIVGGRLLVDQGVIAGCAGGTYDNIVDATDILENKSVGSGAFSLSVYPSSQPVYLQLVENGSIAKLMTAGAVVKTAFCGPCFGAGDVPANNCLSIRHTTRNFPNREGSKPSSGQISSVALMDARSIAATAANGGFLTPATDLSVMYRKPVYAFNSKVYDNRVYDGTGKADPAVALRFGPNITDWPQMGALEENLLLKVAAVITDPVTTTDELIPSGETSSYRSNPEKLSSFTLSRKVPEYVERAKEIREIERARRAGENIVAAAPVAAVAAALGGKAGSIDAGNTGVGTFVYARKPGDGSAREQAASCQKVLGTLANVAGEYATKRYRSNLINWGMLPFIMEGEPSFAVGDWLFVPGVREAVRKLAPSVTGYVVGDSGVSEITLSLPALTKAEAQIILDGCLINHYRGQNAQ